MRGNWRALLAMAQWRSYASKQSPLHSCIFPLLSSMAPDSLCSAGQSVSRSDYWWLREAVSFHGHWLSPAARQLIHLDDRLDIFSWCFLDVTDAVCVGLQIKRSTYGQCCVNDLQMSTLQSIGSKTNQLCTCNLGSFFINTYFYY